MQLVRDILIIGVAALHVWFLVLEMFLWRRPLGRKVFRLSPERAEATAALAANQGLYNGFLAAGLLASFCFADPATAQAFRVFFLGCVIAAGIFGAATVGRSILYVQALPAAVALAATLR